MFGLWDAAEAGAEDSGFVFLVGQTLLAHTLNKYIIGTKIFRGINELQKSVLGCKGTKINLKQPIFEQQK